MEASSYATGFCRFLFFRFIIGANLGMKASMSETTSVMIIRPLSAQGAVPATLWVLGLLATLASVASCASRISLPDNPVAETRARCLSGLPAECERAHRLQGDVFGPEPGERPEVFWDQVCRSGYGPGCAALALHFAQASEDTRDLARARTVAAQGCQQGSAYACRVQGVLAQADAGDSPQRWEHVASLYDKACAGGDHGGCRNAGALAEAAGRWEQAGEAYARACKLKAGASCTALVLLPGLTHQGEARLRLLDRACLGGDARGCLVLGRDFSEGRGVSADPARGVRLYRQSCEAGSSLGCFALATSLESGHGVTRDVQAARELYVEGCEAGVSGACNNLAVLSQRGPVHARDLKQAESLYRRACELGHALACSNLGVMVAEGSSGDPDMQRAHSLFDRACRQQSGQGCANLAFLLWRGLIGERDKGRAMQLIHSACRLGHEASCEQLTRWGVGGRGR